jgi:RHS repeat-associated protein
LIYQHGDQVESDVFTHFGGTDKHRRYNAYGKTRSGTVDAQYTYTAQMEDATGLYYFNACYYDPFLGIFVSPDTIIPDFDPPRCTQKEKHLTKSTCQSIV